MLLTPWRIELFGSLRASQANNVVDRFATVKVAALLARLALFPHRAHSREELIDLFWPEKEAEAGRTSLRAALASLRRQLEPPGAASGNVLMADRVFLRLNPAAFTTDVMQFEQAMAAGRMGNAMGLAEAVRLYRGDLLSGLYDDWVLTERERLAEAYRDALRRLAVLREQAGDWGEALEYARRAVAADPLDEEAQASLIRLLVQTGRPAAARQQWADFARLLAEELGTEPSPATRAMLDVSPGDAYSEESSRPVASSAAPPAAVTVIAPARAEPRLPIRFTRFFGREAEQMRLMEMLASAHNRLITLTGPGGAGKTRLAVEVASQIASQLSGATCFVPLADVWDASRIHSQIAEALGLPRTDDPLEQILKALAFAPSLLVLDNLEQIAEQTAPMIQSLLERLPMLTCLVTSRRRLAAAGEREFPLAPLPIPELAAPLALLAASASVQLFVDRAQMSRPDFQVTKGNAAAVAALCIQLEGIPLALELAAARIQTLTPAQMRERLSQRFELLATKHGDKEARHRSVWAVIDWSYSLLPPALQRFYAHLSVFRGGCSLEAAFEVCREGSALESLTQLRERSLLYTEDAGSEMRFRLMETLREYAAEQLSELENGETADHHAAFFLRMAEASESALRGAAQADWLDRLEAEHDNLRAACDWLHRQASTDEELRFVGALSLFWTMRGYVTEGRARVMQALLRGAEAAPTARAAALMGAGRLAFWQSDYPSARQSYEEALAIRRKIGDRAAVAAILCNLGGVAGQAGDYPAARAFLEESVAVARAMGDRSQEATSLASLALLVQWEGKPEQARAMSEECACILRQLGNARTLAAILHNLSSLERELGDAASAQASLEESLALKRELKDKAGIALALNSLGAMASERNEDEAARALYEESLGLNRGLDEPTGISNDLHGLGRLALRRGDLDTAYADLAESLTLRQRLDIKREITESLLAFALLFLARCQFESATHLLAVRAALRAALDLPFTRAEQAEHDAALTQCRAVLDEAAWEAARGLGQAMGWEQAISCALKTLPTPKK